MQEKKPSATHRDDARQERDDFWDVERLLPQRQTPKRPTYQPPKRSTDAVEMDIPSPTVKTPSPTHTSQPLHIPHAEPRADHGGGAYPVAKDEDSQAPSLEYQSLGYLLHTVKVYTWRTSYHYFDQFISDAQKYANIRGTATRKEPFFSYFPQYAQLSRRQMAWYLWWRDNAKQGNYLETDYAYVLLYIFELINLPAEGETAEEIRDTMASIWMVYRKAYPQLDHYMCEWLCDYCLIHQLTAPVAILLPALGDVLDTARLKEFYLSELIAVGSGDVNLSSARLLLSYCCQYDYRKSKFASGEHKELFDKIIPGAVAAIFPMIINGNTLTMDDSYISRDAYVGALCAYSNKRRIEIAYTSFSRSHDLRFLIGDVVRHTENRLRGSLGVRSRLTTHFLGNDLKKALDAWLDPRLPHAPTAGELAAKHTPRPAYEALYDLPRTQVSIQQADAIEQSSWETTRILTEAFETPLTEETPPVPPPVTPPMAVEVPMRETTTPPPLAEETPPPVADAHPLLVALGDKVAFLKSALAEDRAGQSAYCQATKQLPDAVADEINEITTSTEIYDMVLEEMGGMYVVIDDYKEIINEILKN